MLSPRFKEFHSIWYNYHRTGLDNMMAKPDESKKAMLETIQPLLQMNKGKPWFYIIAVLL